MSVRDDLTRNNRIRQWMDANPGQPASVYVEAFADILERLPDEPLSADELAVFVTQD